MLIIGFGNKARHGKDTAAEAIKNFYDQRNALLLKHGQSKAVTRVGVFKFATALYQEVNKLLCNKEFYETFTERKQAMSVEGVRIPDWVTPNPEYERTELAPYGKHPKLLQWWGTEFRKAQDPDYWVKEMFSSIPVNLDIALISDVRFQNEANEIVNRGGYNVNVQRFTKQGMIYASTDRPANHASETDLDGYNWQFRLSNQEGHQALLAEQAITLAEYLRGLK